MSICNDGLLFYLEFTLVPVSTHHNDQIDEEVAKGPWKGTLHESQILVM